MKCKCKLIEVKYGAFYKKTKVQGYLDIVDRRIDYLYKQRNYKNLTNEQLVLIIQKYDSQECWEILYNKTVNSIRKVMNTYVNYFYRKNEYKDTFSILCIGWINSVKKYDITKATSNFVAFSSTLMKQEYDNKIRKRRSKEKDGVSKKTIPLSTVISNSGEIDNSESSSSGAALNILVDKSSEDEELRIELHDLMQRKLNILKEYYPLSYEMIIENFFNGKTQTQIAKKYNTQQSVVSRHIRIGKRFLKARISDDEYYACFNKKTNY